MIEIFYQFFQYLKKIRKDSKIFIQHFNRLCQILNIIWIYFLKWFKIYYQIICISFIESICFKNSERNFFVMNLKVILFTVFDFIVL